VEIPTWPSTCTLSKTSCAAAGRADADASAMSAVRAKNWVNCMMLEFRDGLGRILIEGIEV